MPLPERLLFCFLSMEKNLVFKDSLDLNVSVEKRNTPNRSMYYSTFKAQGTKVKVILLHRRINGVSYVMQG